MHLLKNLGKAIILELDCNRGWLIDIAGVAGLQIDWCKRGCRSLWSNIQCSS